MAAPLLSVRSLSVLFRPAGGHPLLPWTRRRDGVQAVEDLSIDIAPGETLGLVGPSGSGKSTLALTILGLQPPTARVSGQVLWRGRDLLATDRAVLRSIRGAEIALVPQDPLSALHPLLRVDAQVAEAVRAHAPGIARREALRRAADLLQRTGLAPERLRHAAYPFEWSGGMRQRALIAMAMAHAPALLIADEPTTALDSATAREILDLLREVQRRTGTAILLISHDAAMVERMADRVVEMARGRMVRSRPPRPQSPSGRQPEAAAPAPPAPELLRAESVTVRYRGTSAARREPFDAVQGASFSVAAGEIFCIVGESGAGKSSLARALVGLEEVAGGRVVLDGVDVTRARGRQLRAARRSIQILFQDPYASLNPRRRVGAAIAEPLRVHGLYRGSESDARIAALLERVGLPGSVTHRFPFQLSGGERQRVAIARALILEPRVIVLDEPVSSLDAGTRGAIIELLEELQRSRGLAYVLIAHDLRFVRRIAHRVAVMDRGRIVETGTAAEILERPVHPRTRTLVAAARP